MISHRLLLVPSLALALAACGGPPPANSPGAGPPGHPHGEPQHGHGHGHGAHHGEGHGPEKGEHHEHGKLTPELKAFHEVLKPLWHAEKGPARTDKTCAESKSLNEKAEATKDTALLEATKALAAECEKEGRPEFEARLVSVHERFHTLAR